MVLKIRLRRGRRPGNEERVLNIVTSLCHGRALASLRGTRSTRPRLPSSICNRSSFFLFRQEVIRLLIFRKQHRFLFHEKVIVKVIFSLLLSTSCFLLKKERVKSDKGNEKKVKSASSQWPLQLELILLFFFFNFYIFSGIRTSQ